MEPGLRICANRCGIVLGGIDDACVGLGRRENELAQELADDARTQSAARVRAITNEEINTGRMLWFIDQRTQMRVVDYAVALDKTDRAVLEFDDEASSWIFASNPRRVLRADLLVRRPSRPPSRDEVAVQPAMHRVKIVDPERSEMNPRFIGDEHRRIISRRAVTRD